jgi:amino acid permease
MEKERNIDVRIVAMIVAATIGSGVFAIPYVIQGAGWLISLGYFIALTAVVSLAHILYLRTLEVAGERRSLLGLARKCFGKIGFWIGFFAIVVGLLLSFIAYLVLGTRFVEIIIPGISPFLALILFWLAITALVFKSGGKVAAIEIAGVILILAAVLFVFFSGDPAHALAAVPLYNLNNAFLPFGAVLFSLAGWTSVEQIYEIKKKVDKGTLKFFVLGTAFAGVLYWLFALGILGAAPRVTVDTISGLGSWPFWKKDVLAAIGLLAISTASIPIAREIRGALEKDLKWNSLVSRLVIVGFPLAVVISGFNNFLIIVGLAGGVFISTQYLLIIFVGRHTLHISRREKILLDVLAAIFICAAIYEIVMFVVK